MTPSEFEAIQEACIRVDRAIFADVGSLTQDMIDSLVSLGFEAYDVWAGPWTGSRKAAAPAPSKRHSTDMVDDSSWVGSTFMKAYPLHFAERVKLGTPYVDMLAEDLSRVQDERLIPYFLKWVESDLEPVAKSGLKGLLRFKRSDTIPPLIRLVREMPTGRIAERISDASLSWPALERAMRGESSDR